MTLLPRDCEDILDANLGYHLDRGVDHFIVTDNLSVDATPDIVEVYWVMHCDSDGLWIPDRSGLAFPGLSRNKLQSELELGVENAVEDCRPGRITNPIGFLA